MLENILAHSQLRAPSYHSTQSSKGPWGWPKVSESVTCWDTDAQAPPGPGQGL